MNLNLIKSFRKRCLNIVFNIGRLVSIIFGFRLALIFSDLHNSFYSGWIFKNFKSCGIKLEIAYPLYGSGLKYILIGDNFKAGPRLRIEAYSKFLNDSFTPQIIIGNNVNINFDCHIGCIDKIVIGNNVLIASKVLIIDHFHGESTLSDLKLPPLERPLYAKGMIEIGDNVWIGENCVIMPGVNIGKNCIIGSNSVVTNSFPDNTVIAGSPAKCIKNLA